MSDNKYFEILPSLVINVTDGCNFHCRYCPPFGENMCRGSGEYDEEAVLSVIELAKLYHLPMVRITGGEPFLVPDRVRLFLEASGPSFRRFVINTNGSMIKDSFDWLEQYKNNFVLKISLDSMSSVGFEKMTGVDGFSIVYENLIEAIDRRIDVEINCVIYDQEFEDLCRIADFAIKHTIDCKFLTISAFHGTVDSKSKNENLMQLVDYLSQKASYVSEERLEGRRGGTMLVYPIGDSKLYLFDHSVEDSLTPKKSYLSICNQCEFYPCDSGAISLSISTDGILTPCRGRKDLGTNIFYQPKVEIQQAFKKQLDYYKSCFSININTRQQI